MHVFVLVLSGVTDWVFGAGTGWGRGGGVGGRNGVGCWTISFNSSNERALPYDPRKSRNLHSSEHEVVSAVFWVKTGRNSSPNVLGKCTPKVGLLTAADGGRELRLDTQYPDVRGSINGQAVGPVKPICQSHKGPKKNRAACFELPLAFHPHSEGVKQNMPETTLNP